MPDITYQPGELFVYTNGDKWELGLVKRPNNTGDGYFCYYSTGDTAANTPTSRMHKLANHGWSKIEGRLDDLESLCRDLLLLAVSGASTTYDRAKWHADLERLSTQMEDMGLLG